MNNLWGPVDPIHVRSVPFTSGRLATEDDVRSGAAVFYLQPPAEGSSKAEPYEMKLPTCAIHKDGDIKTPIVIIQAEQADGRTIIGARPLSGGNMACLLEECEIVAPTDPNFVCLIGQ